jgi:hypothetical protein
MVAPVLYGIGSLAARFGMPVARELVKKYGPGIIDALAGTSAGAYIGDKLFFGQDVRETPEGLDIGPETKDPPTLEELKERNVETFPGEAVPPFKLPGFNEGVTGIDELTKPTGFGEGFPETTLEDITSSGGFQKEDVPDMSIMTMNKGFTRKDLEKIRGEVSGKLEKFFKDKDEFTQKDLEKDFVFKTFEKVFDKYGVKRTDLRKNVNEDYKRLFKEGYISEDTLNKLKRYGIDRRVKVTGIQADQAKEKELAVDEKSKLALEYLNEMQASSPDTPITVNQPFLYKQLSEKYPDLFPANKSDTRMREVIREIKENQPEINKFISIKRKIDPETLVPEEPRQMNLRREEISKAMYKYYPNEVIESVQERGPKYFDLKDKKDQVSLQANPKFKFYEFLSRTMPETDIETLFKKVKLGDPSDLSNPAQRIFNEFKKFEDVRKEVNPLLKPFIQRIFGNDRASIQIAHSFKSSKLSIPKSKKTTEEVIKDIDPEKFIGQGINPDFLYLDISPYNQGIQNTLESKASAALEKKDFKEYDRIDQLMENIGVEGIVGGQTIGKRKKLSVKLRGLINELENRGESIPEYNDVIKAIEILQSSGKSGYKTGGLVGISHLTRPL